MAKYVLIFRTGSLAGREETISADKITIGRDPVHPVVIDDLKISRNHARILMENGHLLFEDLKSTNGSFINGRRVTRATKLRNGDLISLGEENVFEVTGIELPGGHSEGGRESSESASATSKNHDFSPLDQLPVEEREGSKDELPKNAQLGATKTREKPAAKFLASLPTWAVILFIAVGFIILFCLIPFVVIEVTNQWCNLFSGFFNAISPGVCP